MNKLLSDAISQVVWILVAIVVLTILAFSLPFIFKKIFSRKSNICICGEKLEQKEKFCPKCGRKVEK